VESSACMRRLRLLNTALGRVHMVLEFFEYHKLRRAEKLATRAFEKVLVCSDLDVGEVMKRTGARNIHRLANGIRLPSFLAAPAATTAAQAPVLLFVGSLDYFPNVEGIIWLTREVMPLLRSNLPQGVRLQVVGRNPDRRLHDLAKQGAFELHADVAEVLPFYEQAHVIVAPIHAGSGTRIKILEAFGTCRPVVSTTLGAEGLDASPGVQLLIADTPSDFAARIQYLLGSPVAAQDMALAARQFVEDRFALPVISRLIARLAS
jgi:polysaccharide biosynthesis protein PslH